MAGTITPAERDELEQCLADLRADVLVAQNEADRWQSQMNELDQGEWRRWYRLNHQVSRLQRRILSITMLLATYEVREVA